MNNNQIPEAYKSLICSGDKINPATMEYRQYLPLNGKISWFRAEHPDGRLIAKEIQHEVNASAVFEADIYLSLTDTTPVASARAIRFKTDDGTYYSSCQSAALNQALSMAGYGCQADIEKEVGKDTPASITSIVGSPATLEQIPPLNKSVEEAKVVSNAKPKETSTKKIPASRVNIPISSTTQAELVPPPLNQEADQSIKRDDPKVVAALGLKWPYGQNYVGKTIEELVNLGKFKICLEWCLSKPEGDVDATLLNAMCLIRDIALKTEAA